MARSAARLDLPNDLTELPEGWEYSPLGRLVEEDRGICYGIVQPGSHAEDGVPIVRVNNIRNGRISTDDVLRVQPEIETKYERSRLRGGEVLLTLVGSLGESAIVPTELAGWNVARAVGIIPVLANVGSRWVDLCLRSAMSQHFIRIWATTTVQATFNLRDVARLPIPLPPEKERQAIACILGTLDDKIELNRRRNRTLEAMARAIFQSWFVDFDPVKAKAAGQTPPGLKPELASIFPDAFEESELGGIPKGWRVGTVGDVAEFNDWTLGKRDELDEIDYIEISEVMRGDIASITRYVRGEEPSRARRRLRHGDTAISTVRPDRGSYFLSIDPSQNLIASTGFAVLSARGGHWAFVHVLTTRADFGQELGRLADGGAYPAIRPEVIAARPVVIPATDELLSAFEKLAQPLFLKAEAGRKESRTLAAMRDTLLPKLISGELRVPDAERIVGRAT